MLNDPPHFTVFGGAYVPEHHNACGCADLDGPAVRRRDLAAGASWLVFSTLILGLTICAAEITFFAGRSSGLL